MADFHWTMPIARWVSISAAAGAVNVDFVEPMARRRLSLLSRLALRAAHDCAGGYEALRIVFASRHGELTRTTGILDAICASEPVSPTAFSLSVLNAMTGVFGIARGDRSAASAISAGSETLGYALLEAFAQCESDAASPVLLVYANEPAGSLYGEVDDDTACEALALLIDHRAAAGFLSCDVTKASLGSADFADEKTAAADTQSAAVQRCLAECACAIWRSDDVVWRWRWHDTAH